jgi:hypothetical protein
VLNANATERNPRHLALIAIPAVVRMATGPDRFWLFDEAVPVDPDAGSLDAFVSRVELTGEVPLLVHERARMLDRGALAAGAGPAASFPAEQALAVASVPAARRADVDIVEYGTRDLVLDVRADRSGWLLVTDRWARGWRATVGDTAVDVFGANFIFRAVRIPAGRSRVAFHFAPAFFPWLAWLSWAILAIIAAAAIRSRSLD